MARKYKKNRTGTMNSYKSVASLYTDQPANGHFIVDAFVCFHSIISGRRAPKRSGATWLGTRSISELDVKVERTLPKDKDEVSVASKDDELETSVDESTSDQNEDKNVPTPSYPFAWTYIDKSAWYFENAEGEVYSRSHTANWYDGTSDSWKHVVGERASQLETKYRHYYYLERRREKNKAHREKQLQRRSKKSVNRRSRTTSLYDKSDNLNSTNGTADNDLSLLTSKSMPDVYKTQGSLTMDDLFSSEGSDSTVWKENDMYGVRTNPETKNPNETASKQEVKMSPIEKRIVENINPTPTMFLLKQTFDELLITTAFQDTKNSQERRALTVDSEVHVVKQNSLDLSTGSSKDLDTVVKAPILDADSRSEETQCKFLEVANGNITLNSSGNEPKSKEITKAVNVLHDVSVEIKEDVSKDSKKPQIIDDKNSSPNSQGTTTEIKTFLEHPSPVNKIYDQIVFDGITDTLKPAKKFRQEEEAKRSSTAISPVPPPPPPPPVPPRAPTTTLTAPNNRNSYPEKIKLDKLTCVEIKDSNKNSYPEKIKLGKLTSVEIKDNPSLPVEYSLKKTGIAVSPVKTGLVTIRTYEESMHERNIKRTSHEYGKLRKPNPTGRPEPQINQEQPRAKTYGGPVSEKNSKCENQVKGSSHSRAHTMPKPAESSVIYDSNVKEKSAQSTREKPEIQFNEAVTTSKNPGSTHDDSTFEQNNKNGNSVNVSLPIRVQTPPLVDTIYVNYGSHAKSLNKQNIPETPRTSEKSVSPINQEEELPRTFEHIYPTSNREKQSDLPSLQPTSEENVNDKYLGYSSWTANYPPQVEMHQHPTKLQYPSVGDCNLDEGVHVHKAYPARVEPSDVYNTYNFNSFNRTPKPYGKYVPLQSYPSLDTSSEEIIVPSDQDISLQETNELNTEYEIDIRSSADERENFSSLFVKEVDGYTSDESEISSFNPDSSATKRTSEEVYRSTPIDSSRSQMKKSYEGYLNSMLNSEQHEHQSSSDDASEHLDSTGATNKNKDSQHDSHDKGTIKYIRRPRTLDYMPFEPESSSKSSSNASTPDASLKTILYDLEEAKMNLPDDEMPGESSRVTKIKSRLEEDEQYEKGHLTYSILV